MMSVSSTPPTVHPHDQLLRAATRFFPNATKTEPVGNHAHLLHVETDSGSWVVHRWPQTTTPERVAYIHRILNLARSEGIDVVPAVATTADGDSIVVIDDMLFDAQSWLPGRTPTRGLEVTDPRGRVINRPAQLSASAITATIHAVAKFHLATESLAADADLPRASLEAVLRAVRSAWDEYRQRLRPLAPRTPHIQRWIRSSEPVFDGAIESVTSANFLQLRPRVIAHLNLWPAHLLISRRDGDESLTGLIDFSESAASSPVLDLAQIITHFNGWTGASAEAAIGAYTSVRPLAPEERRLLPAIAGLDLIVETGRLLVLGHATPAIVETGGGDTIRSAAASMLLSLEAIAPAVQRGDRPEPPKARKWDYSRPKAGVKRPPRDRPKRG